MSSLAAMRVLLGWILVVALSGAAALAVAELSYRFYVLDFYAPELRAYNPPADILIMGDSFSAGQQSYVARLRLLMPECRIVNGAIPGSGIIESNVLAPSLFESYHPDFLVYQLYVGNDLINIRYPKNWSAVPWVRNIVWSLFDRFKILSYLNYRLGQVRRSWAGPDHEGLVRSQSTELFSVADYPPYMKNYLKADSRVIEKQIVLDGDRSADFELLIRGLRDLLANCRHGSCTPVLLVIPDAVQVGEVYFEDMIQLGAEFVGPQQTLLAESYPFIAQLERIFDEDARIRILNVVKPLQEAQRTGAKTYFRNDPHLAPLGQQVVAEELAQELHRANLDCLAEHADDAADTASLRRRQN